MRTAEQGVLEMEKLISLDGLERICPYFYCGESFGGYNCNHPECEDSQDGKEGICASWSCPLAYGAEYPDVKRFDPLFAKEEFKEYYEKHGCNDVNEWMVLFDEKLIEEVGKDHPYFISELEGTELIIGELCPDYWYKWYKRLNKEC